MQCCRSGMFIPDPTFFHPGSRIYIKEFKHFNPKNWFFSNSRNYDPGCSSRIRIQDPGVKKAPDPQHWFYEDCKNDVHTTKSGTRVILISKSVGAFYCRSKEELVDFSTYDTQISCFTGATVPYRYYEIKFNKNAPPQYIVYCITQRFGARFNSGAWTLSRDIDRSHLSSLLQTPRKSFSHYSLLIIKGNLRSDVSLHMGKGVFKYFHPQICKLEIYA